MKTLDVEVAMARVLVILGSETTPAQHGRMSRSARAAVALASSRFDASFETATLRYDAAACRYALAAGASAADALPFEQLATQVRDVALLGGDLGEGDFWGARLAQAWQAALIFDVLDVQREGTRLRVVRDCGRGAREILSVTGPAVLVVSPESPVRQYVSHHRRQRVGAERVRSSSQTALPETKWEPAQPRAKTGDLASRNRAAAADRMLAAFGIGNTEVASETPRQVIEADARTCAEHLLRYLAHHGLLDRQRVSSWILEERSAGTPQDQSLLASVNPKPAPARSSAGISSQTRRGPRAIDEENSGILRRPRGLQSPTIATASIPNRIARRPRASEGDLTRNLRGPVPVSLPETSESTFKTP